MVGSPLKMSCNCYLHITSGYFHRERGQSLFLDSSANITKTDIRLSLIVISTDAGAIQLGKYLFMFYKQSVLNRGN